MMKKAAESSQTRAVKPTRANANGGCLPCDTGCTTAVLDGSIFAAANIAQRQRSAAVAACAVGVAINSAGTLHAK